MDINLKIKILEELQKEIPWESYNWQEKVLRRLIENPEMTKEDLCKVWIKMPGRKKPISFNNEYIASKYIKVFRECIKI